jgi:hypothetical protein
MQAVLVGGRRSDSVDKEPAKYRQGSTRKAHTLKRFGLLEQNGVPPGDGMEAIEDGNLQWTEALDVRPRRSELLTGSDLLAYREPVLGRRSAQQFQIALLRRTAIEKVDILAGKRENACAIDGKDAISHGHARKRVLAANGTDKDTTIKVGATSNKSQWGRIADRHSDGAKNAFGANHGGVTGICNVSNQKGNTNGVECVSNMKYSTNKNLPLATESGPSDIC